MNPDPEKFEVWNETLFLDVGKANVYMNEMFEHHGHEILQVIEVEKITDDLLEKIDERPFALVFKLNNGFKIVEVMR